MTFTESLFGRAVRTSAHETRWIGMARLIASSVLTHGCYHAGLVGEWRSRGPSSVGSQRRGGSTRTPSLGARTVCERPRTTSNKKRERRLVGGSDGRRPIRPSQQSQHATSRRGGVRPRRRAPATGAMAEEKVSIPTEHAPHPPSVRARITRVARPRPSRHHPRKGGAIFDTVPEKFKR